MKSVISIITDVENSNAAIITKLRRTASILKVDQKVKAKAEQTQNQILKCTFPPNSIPAGFLKQGRGSTQLEEKKEIIKYYLRLGMGSLTLRQEEQRNDLKCLDHICRLYEIEQIKNSECDAKASLLYLLEMQKQYSVLERELKNEGLLNLIHHRLNICRSQTNNQLRILTKREKNIMITLKMGIIKECIPHLDELSVYTHWMFGVFEDLMEFNGVERVLKLNSITLPEDKVRQNDLSFRRLDITVVSLNFMKDSKQQVEAFIEALQSTYRVIESIQGEIKRSLEESIGLQRDQAKREIKKRVLLGIEKQQQQFRVRAGQQLLPSIYLFSNSHRSTLLKTLRTPVSLDMNTMASLLLSYKYCVNSKYIQSTFSQIAHEISQKLVSGGDKQFQEVCFFLEINTKTVSKKEGKNNIRGADFALTLVEILIRECVDRVHYEKVERLLLIQNSLRQFKNTITY